MKVVILNGSPRKGNTYSSIEALKKGLEKNHTVEVLDTDKLNVSPCKGCGACEMTKGCVSKDDSNMVVQKIVDSDFIVFASPIYWWGITAQLKTVLDKCYSKGALLKEKKVGLILCAASETNDEEFSLINRQFELIAEYLSWDYKFFKKYFASEKDDMKKDVASLKELEELGLSI